ncbi:hypothetical protein [Deinococcus hopiensis]|uniref:hypothetical protein n=1 Tax=Deinococcus hopiensis TaxID=309885 RepID=UPI00111BF5AA|nr:hypothetical protein [Deinococcus hopiensis]
MQRLVLGCLFTLASSALASGFLGTSENNVSKLLCQKYGCKQLFTSSYDSISMGILKETGYQLLKINAKVIISSSESGHVVIAETLTPQSPPDEQSLNYFIQFVESAMGSKYRRDLYYKCFDNLDIDRALKEDEEIRQMRSRGGVEENPKNPAIGEDRRNIASSQEIAVDCFLRPYRNSGVTGIRVYFPD